MRHRLQVQRGVPSSLENRVRGLSTLTKALPQTPVCPPYPPPLACSLEANADGVDLTQGRFGSFSYTGPVDDIAVFFTAKAGEDWDTAAPLQLRDSFRPVSAIIKLYDLFWDEWWAQDYVSTMIANAMGELPVQGLGGSAGGPGGVLSCQGNTHMAQRGNRPCSAALNLTRSHPPPLRQQATRWASPLTC